MTLVSAHPEHNRTRIYRHVFLTGLLILLSALICGAQTQPTDNSASPAQLASEVLKQEVENLKIRIQESQSDVDKSAAVFETTERLIHDLSTRRTELETRINDAKRATARLNSESETQKQQLPAIQNQIVDTLIVHQRLSSQSKLRILLSSNDPTRIQRILKYFDYLTTAETQKLKILRQAIDRMQQTQNQLVTHSADLNRLQKELNHNIDTLNREQKTRRRLIEELRTGLTQDIRVLEQKRAQQQRLQQLLAGLEKLPVPPPADTAPSPEVFTAAGLSSQQGHLILPLMGPITTRFLQKDALSGVPSTGIVISGRMGADIRSISAGRVVYSDWFRGFGLLLVLDHGDGFMSLYGYNSKLLYPVGAKVVANTSIAKAGDTSGRLNAGVYFEIRHQGEAVDPLLWCKTEE